MTANTYSERIRITVLHFTVQDLEALDIFVLCLRHVRTVFSLLLKRISLLHLCVKTEWPSLQEKVSADTIIFLKTVNPLFVFLNVWIRHHTSLLLQVYLYYNLNLFFNICPNAVVRHVAQSHSYLPWQLDKEDKEDKLDKEDPLSG